MHNFLQLSVWKDMRWGTWSLICLYISVLSGIIVGLQYDYSTSFYSSTSIDLLVPFGRYFRSLHFYSSQFFFLLTCIHLIAVYQKTSTYGRGEWLKLVGTLPIILLLLFTGYVLRGDITGVSAGSIAENIIQSIPLLGTVLDNTLFSISETGLRKVYLHHVISLDFLFLLLAWNHLRTYRIRVSEHPTTIVLVLLFSIFISAPLDGDVAGINYISGPWFFLGLQELLRYMHPLIAGVIIPCIFIYLLCTAHAVMGRFFRYSLYGITIYLFLYAILTVIALSR